MYFILEFSKIILYIFRIIGQIKNALAIFSKNSDKIKLLDHLINPINILIRL